MDQRGGGKQAVRREKRKEGEGEGRERGERRAEERSYYLMYLSVTLHASKKPEPSKMNRISSSS